MSPLPRSTSTLQPDPAHQPPRKQSNQQKKEVRRRLQQLGANTYDMQLPESYSLPRVLLPEEVIEGIVYGRITQTNGPPPTRGMLVATDRRIILLEHRPLFERINEITYEVVSAISYSHIAFVGTVNMTTRLGEMTVRSYNLRTAVGFVQAVEGHIFAPPTIAM